MRNLSSSMPASESLNAAGFSTSRDDVFARIAGLYDLLCDLFSLWLHRYWKRRVAALVAAEEWRDLLDVASGTGDIVLRVLARQPPAESRRIIASDISPQMLAIAEQRLSKRGHRLELRQLDAQSMPGVAAASVDLFAISLALKICDRQAVLREAFRVLRPGGRLIVLEASMIRARWLQQLYLLYVATCMPVIGWLATGGDASAYRYLLQGIRAFPAAEALADEMRHAGFVAVSFERLSLGIVAIHVAHKPAADTSQRQAAT